MMKAYSRRAAIAAALPGIFPLAGMTLDISPSLTLGEIYSSNVDLATDAAPTPPGESKEDWITRVAPRVEIGYQGNRLGLDIDYTYEALFYALESDRNEAYNQLLTSGLFDLVGEELQLRGRASLMQVNVTPEDPVTNSNINTTGNRTDAMVWDIGPVWRRKVFGNSETEGYLSVGQVNYDSPEIQDVETLLGRLSVHTSDARPGALTYEAVYEYDKLNYEISGDSVVQATWLQIGYQINETYQVFGLGGLDSDFEDPDSGSLNEPRWEVGAASSLPADNLRASVGRRFFGTTYSFNWDHKSGDATYGVSYSDSPTIEDLNSLQELPANPPGTEPGTPPPDSAINRPGTATRYVLRRADLDASWTLYRSTLLMNVFWEERHDQRAQSASAADETTPLQDENSYGATVDFVWELGSRTDASFGAGWTHREFSNLTDCDPNIPGDCAGIGTGSDELYTLRAGLDHELGPRTTLQFETGYQSRQQGDVGDYDEFWASAQVMRAFGRPVRRAVR
jgi:uncharacterized protein (PEP-CTERM system associated)